MAITYEYGQRVEGEWRVVAEGYDEARNVVIKPGVVYEFVYQIKFKIPIPGISWLQEKVAEAIVRIQMKIKGLKILYLRIEDTMMIVQCVKEVTDEAQQTLAVSTAFSIGLIILFTFAGLGIFVGLVRVSECVRKLPPVVPPLIGAGTLIAIAVIIYLLSQKKLGR